MDVVSQERRSAIMRAVKQKNTEPELRLRKMLHALGYRYRLHRPDLPGRPDLVFPSRRAVIFVHGCFWHGHECSAGRAPSSNIAYWTSKIAANRDRDTRTSEALVRDGWRVLTVWECTLKEPGQALATVRDFHTVEGSRARQPRNRVQSRRCPRTNQKLSIALRICLSI